MDVLVSAWPNTATYILYNPIHPFQIIKHYSFVKYVSSV
jgi:hypothetical protein